MHWRLEGASLFNNMMKVVSTESVHSVTCVSLHLLTQRTKMGKAIVDASFKSIADKHERRKTGH
jgi:hypothetical protein